MSATIPCVPCCATQQIVDVPGSPGLNGADGAAGLNAFTTLAGTSPVGDITIPAVGAPVAAPFIVVADNSWAVIGQYIFISDGDAGHMGTFLVTATTGTTVIQATFVGPAANVGNVIHSSSGTVSPAKVTPSGPPGPAFVIAPVIGTQENFATALTAVFQTIGTATIVLAASVDHLYFARASIRWQNVTFAANRTITMRIRNTTTNTTIATMDRFTETAAGHNYPASDYVLPFVIDTLGVAGDSIALQIMVDVVDAGTTGVIEAGSICAIPLT